MKINRNFDNLVPNYLFADVARKTAEYAAANPDKKIIRLGIGDVTLPLAPVVVEAMKQGAEELAHKETFKGYPEYEGYDFLREAISGYYKSFGVSVSPDEIFVSDGAKSDCGNIGDIFSQDNTVLVTDPVYPVYVDSNIMAGRKIIYTACNEQNGFSAMPDESVKADIIFLCSPNNPTGAAFTFGQLKAWVDYANKNDAVILYDAAYEAFITEDLPRSIYAIELAAATRLSRRSLSATVTICMPHGTAVRQQSSTAFHIPFSALRQQCSARRDSARSARISPTIRRTRALSRLLSMSSVSTIRAARTHPTSG